MTFSRNMRPFGLLLVSALALLGPSTVRAQAETHVHTVQPGETIQDIASANGLRSVSVMAANALSNPDVLQIGQSLVIPPIDGVLHTVKSGETLAAIADQFGVSTADLVSANSLQSADDLSVGEVLVVPGVSLAERAVQAAATQAEATVPAPSRATSETYVVQDGDTLRSIAESVHLDILSLVAMNGIDDPDLIRPGSRLQVSAHPQQHVVQAGDTVGDIAFQYSVDPNALLRVNGLDDPDRIVTGMTLVIPLGAAAAAPAPVVVAPAPAAPAPVAAAPTAAPPAPRPKPTPAPAPAPPPAPARSSSMTAMVTGYAIGAGAVSSHTASGTTTHWGTVAADIRLYPFGTRLRIEGLGDTVFTVEDTGSAVRGNVFDVWCPDAAAARQLGAVVRQVTILGPGEP
jgi:peptidoglycan DL-endopeptidase LytF